VSEESPKLIRGYRSPREGTVVPLRRYTLLTARKLTATLGRGGASAAVASTVDLIDARALICDSTSWSWASTLGREVPANDAAGHPIQLWLTPTDEEALLVGRGVQSPFDVRAACDR
jgi:hypothetical protein